MNNKNLSKLAIIGAAFSILGVSLPAQAINFDVQGDPVPNIDVPAPGTTASLNVTETGIIEDLWVSVELTDDNSSELFWTDLDMTLSHNGTTVKLNEGIDRTEAIMGGGIFNISFYDQSLQHLPKGGNATGQYSPEKPLNFQAFAGQELSGLWELNIQDSIFPGDQNQLASWSISGTTNSAAVPFEFSPSLGMFMVGGLFFGNYWRKQKK